MISYIKKEHILLNIKIAVWNKCSIYPLNPEITQCKTCNNLVLIPESIKKIYNISYDIKPIYVNGKRKNINGVAEFGHIISEFNGGKICEDNLIIQCKTCNTKQGSKNINVNQIMYDIDMLDNCQELNIEMGENYEYCQYICSSKLPCKNKAIINRRFCHIHLIN